MRWGLALAAAAAVLGAAVARGGAPAGARGPPRVEGDGVCELGQVNRTRTSARRCIACHDGSVGEGIMFDMRGDGLGMNHPVEVDYAAAVARHPGEYAPEAQLPPGLPLVRGKVACTTCHDAGSAEPHHVRNYETLCTSCHVK